MASFTQFQQQYDAIFDGGTIQVPNIHQGPIPTPPSHPIFDRRSLFGKKVKIVFTATGRHSRQPKEGIIVGVDELQAGNSISRLPINIRLDTGKIARVYFSQLDISVKPENLYTSLVSGINSMINRETREYQNKVESLTNELNAFRERIQTTKREIEETKKRIPATREYGLKELKAEMKKIKSINKIADVYISNVGHIVVLTKPLYAVGKNYKEDKKKELGRFAIRLCFNENHSGCEKHMEITNLDYSVYYSPNHYDHPHIKNGIVCWGDQERTVVGLLWKGELQALISFIVPSLAAFPQDRGANPYLNYGRWLKEKRKRRSPSELEGRA